MWGTKRRYCDGLARRDVLRIGGLGLGLSLADLLRLKAQGAVNPAGRPKSVIMVYLGGGLSHIDTYDMKPAAPAEFRGEFRPIRTQVPGLDVCELLPLQAKIADKFSVVRGVKAYSPEHSSFEQVTGAAEAWKPLRPAIGSVVSRVRGESAMPHFVNLAVTAGNVTIQHDPSYLGAIHRPFAPYDQAIMNLSLRGTPERLADRQRLLRSLDTIRRELDARGEMIAMDEYQTQAMDMIRSGAVRTAFDVKLEPDHIRARYAPAPQLLLARRLVESGVSMVTTLLTPPLPLTWDTHTDNFGTLRRALPFYDNVMYNLLTDLYDRGLDQDVLVVVWGEFGRSPRVNREGGRDHWVNTNCVLFAGGGLRMGQVVGNSGPRGVGAQLASQIGGMGQALGGEQNLSGVYSPQTIAAMIYRVLGIDPAMTLPDHAGRPVSLVDERNMIPELL
ncbi:MAG: hypothetical protein JWN70_4606 [Planctomycetaceae bacterium]|nr:hypothetical protein [Planctomycetaceae bacterium]